MEFSLLRNRTPDTLGGGGEDADGFSDGVVDGGHDRGAAGDQWRFADATRAEGAAGVGILQHDTFDVGHIADGRQDVIGEAGIHDFAIFHHYFFHQRHADALGNAALNLAEDLIGVDGFANVVAGDVTLNCHFTSFRIDENLARVASKKVGNESAHALAGLRVLGHRGWLVYAHRFQGKTTAFAFAGDFFERHALLWMKYITGYAVLDLDLVDQFLEVRRRDVLQLLLQFRGSEQHGGTGEIRLSCRRRTAGFRRQLRICENRSHVVQRHADFLGNNLRDHVDETLADIHCARVDFDGAVGCQLATGAGCIRKTVTVAEAKTHHADAVAAL